MWTLRRSLDDRPERSGRLWQHVETLPAVADAPRILVFDTIPGEPETETFTRWCVGRGVEVAIPAEDPEPGWADVVIVPGLAFTPSGRRLGQGGGWYDRFLAEISDTCETVGVCFHEQLLDDVPVEPHDVAVRHVVTDRGPA